MSTETKPEWAIVELMGHVRYGGLVSKDTLFSTPLIRVDVPQPDGSFISQLVNPSSIYRLTMCAEPLARTAAAAGNSSPMHIWEVKHLLPDKPQPPEEPDDDYDYEQQ